MTTFRVGQKVTLKTNVRLNTSNGEISPQFGVVYTVRDISDYGGGAGLRFVEIVNNPQSYDEAFGELTFAAEEFRPLVTRETDISIFTAMLAPPKKIPFRIKPSIKTGEHTK